MKAVAGRGESGQYEDGVEKEAENKCDYIGEAMMEFLIGQGMVAAGTCFKQKDNRTWSHPKTGNGRMIDHIMIPRKDQVTFVGWDVAEAYISISAKLYDM